MCTKKAERDKDGMLAAGASRPEETVAALTLEAARLSCGIRLVDVPRDDRLAKQITGAHSDSPDGRLGVEEPKGCARIVSPSMVKGEATIDVSFDPKYDVLPRHVFQTHTNSPAIAPIGEIRELPTRDVYCTGA